jgi:hypothetical protein
MTNKLVVELFFNEMLTVLAAAVLIVINLLWALLSKTAFSTPAVTTLPQVTAITSNSLMIVNVSFVLAIITAGIVVMTRETVQTRYGIAELAPRLVIGWIAANFAVPICANLIRLANALSTALTGDGVTSKNSLGQMKSVTVDALNNPPSAFLAVIIGLVIAVLTAMLILTWIARLGVLVVLAGIAPIALACHATPYTDPAARLWWRALLGTLATVVLQALALHTALSIFLNPAANMTTLGIPHDPTGTFNLFLVLCLLWVVIKIPGLMRRYVTGGGGHNMAGTLVRMVLIQQLTSMLRIPARRGGGGGRATAAAGGARGGRAVGATGQLSAANTVIPYWRPRMPRPTPSASRPTPTPAGGGSGTGGGGQPSSGRPAVPAGVNPATAMPRTRPAWQSGGGARPARGQQPAPAASPRVPAGTTPATAMPRTRPAWQTPPASPQPAPPPPPQPRRQIPPGVNPGNAMPRRRPTWRR